MSGAHKKIALVTGATRGIGFETARGLADQGVHVLLGGRDPVRAASTAQMLSKRGLDVEPCQIDVTSSDSILAAAERIRERYGHLDILVNNAGIRIEQYGLKPSQQPLDQWRATLETNLLGPVAVTKAFLPLIKTSKAGRIVNVASYLASLSAHSDKASYAYTPKFKSLPAYSASKSALNAWTIHLAFELRDTPIKVNSVHPGYTRTDMNDGEGDLSPAQGAATSVRLALLDDDGPTGGFFHNEEVVPW